MEEREEQKEATAASPSKRTLLKAVWVAPVILAVTLPGAVMAQASGIPAPPVIHS